MTVPDAPLVDCGICLNEISKLVELPCNHKCCDECVRRIDKCHMCRCELKKSEVFKTYLKLTLLKSTVVKIPFYYDTLNLEIDNILMLACINEINIILSDYGYKTYVSLELD
jgi:hypothetical protein